MKRNLTAFFVIALSAELGTTWLQKLRTTTDVAPGRYYPNFERLLLDRLLFWFVIFVVLAAAWILISRRSTRT